MQNTLFVHNLFSCNITNDCSRLDAALCDSAKTSFDVITEVLGELKKQGKKIYLDFDLQIVVREKRGAGN